MIKVGVAAEDDPDVFQLESERLDIGTHQRTGLLHRRIDKNVSFRGSDEKAGKIVSPDIVDVTNDAEALEWLIP